MFPLGQIEFVISFFADFSIGSPEPDVTWYKDGSQIKVSKRVKVEWDMATDMNILNIKNATEDDSGEYTVKVENDKGSASYTVSVNIGPEQDETVVQEVITVHKVSEKTETIEGTVEELAFQRH